MRAALRLALCGVLATFAGLLQAADGPPRNIVLIGWDGAQRNHVKECLGRGELPNLKKLSSEGALVDIDVVDGATDTKAGWTQILTGYRGEVTGTLSNRVYRDCPPGYSVFERLKAHFGPDKFICVAVIGKSGHCGEIRPPYKKPLGAKDANAPAGAPGARKGKAGKGGRKTAQPGATRNAPVEKIVEENGVKYRVFLGSPYCTMHKSCDVWDYGLTLDEKVGPRAIELLEKYKDKPLFFFVHFATVDHSGHKHGENSKEYNDALISNDTWTGRIIDKLKELGLYDKTLVYVTADHGFNEGATNHRYAPYVVLATNDAKVCRRGLRQDIAPTILDRFGLDLGKFAPPLDGEPLTKPATRDVPTAPETRPAAGKAGKRPGKQGAKRGGRQRPAAVEAPQ